MTSGKNDKKTGALLLMQRAFFMRAERMLFQKGAAL